MPSGWKIALALSLFATGLSAESVAIVASLHGSAAVFEKDSRRDLRMYDWLSPNMHIEVGEHSAVRLVFKNGTRYELLDRSRVTIGPSGLSALSGAVHPLSSVPPLPPIAPVKNSSDDPEQAAVQMRAGASKIKGLYPRTDVMAIPSSVTLRFEPLPGTRRYKVDVEDAEGNAIFSADTEASSVHLDSLKPGSRYYFTVRSIDVGGWTSHGESEFRTLATDQLQARDALLAAVTSLHDPDAIALLAGVDIELGLLAEAREELEKAVELSPEDKSLKVALAALEARLTR